MTQLPIFVINLPNASNRRELINQQFYKYDLKSNFFFALNGKLIESSFLSKFKIREGEEYLGRKMVLPELGCNYYCSHAVIIKVRVKNICVIRRLCRKV